MLKSSFNTRSNHLHSKTVNMLGVWEGFRFMPRRCSRSSGRSLTLVLPIMNCVIRILVKSISVPEGKRSAFLRIPDQVIGAQRRWRDDCGESDRDRQAQNWAEVFRSEAEARGFLPPQQQPGVSVSSGMGLQGKGRRLSPFLCPTFGEARRVLRLRFPI